MIAPSVTVTLSIREALALLSISLEARHDRLDRRQGLLEAESKLSMAIWEASPALYVEAGATPGPGAVK